MGQCIIDRNKTYEDFISNQEMWFAQEYQGRRLRYTYLDMESLWRCILSERERVDKLKSLEYTPATKTKYEYKDEDFHLIDL